MIKLYVTLPDDSDSLYITVPDNSDSVFITMPEIGIDPQKVLMLVNSDVALSNTMADYYISARGLNATHKITKSLGTHNTIVGGVDGADPDTFYNNVVLPIANYIDANNIEAVIGSARVPHLTAVKPDPQVMNISTMSVLGSSRYLRDVEGGMVRGIGVNQVAPQYDTLVAGNGWFHEPFLFSYGASDTNIANNAFLDFRFASYFIPYGRLGLPKFEAAVPDETQVETQRMIDDSIATSEIGISGGEIHLGFDDRVKPDITGYQLELARQKLESRNIPTKHYIKSYSIDWPSAPPPEDYSYADMIAGSLSETAFGMVGAAIANANVGDPYVNSYTWVQGSWGFEATSFGHYLMANMLMNGACSGVGTVLEPLSGGMCETDSFLNNLVAGRNMCEAMFFGKLRFPWMMDCWGDPLHTPYPRKY